MPMPPGYSGYSWLMDGTKYLQGNLYYFRLTVEKKTEQSSSCQREGESYMTVVSGCFNPLEEKEYKA